MSSARGALAEEPQCQRQQVVGFENMRDHCRVVPRRKLGLVYQVRVGAGVGVHQDQPVVGRDGLGQLWRELLQKERVQPAPRSSKPSVVSSRTFRPSRWRRWFTTASPTPSSFLLWFRIQ